MPELPEVETIRRQLEKALIGKRFVDIEIRSAKQFIGEKKNALNQKIIAINRYGKMIEIDMAGDFSLLIHLKLTGQLIWQKNPKSMQKNLSHQYVRIIFELSDGSRLFFNDLRKFGWIKIEQRLNLPAGKAGIKEQRVGLGTDALSKDLTEKYLHQIFARKKNTKIKQVLMDQSLIAGIGNIYSDEILFCAKILSTKKAGQLAATEIKKIHHCIGKILALAIKLGGASASDYRQIDGEKGSYMDKAMVYGRKGQLCHVCQGPIKWLKIHGRTTHYCPHCQR